MTSFNVGGADGAPQDSTKILKKLSPEMLKEIKKKYPSGEMLFKGIVNKVFNPVEARVAAEIPPEIKEKMDTCIKNNDYQGAMTILREYVESKKTEE